LSFQTIAAPLLYFVTFAAILVLFSSAIAVFVWVLARLRWLLVRWLGGEPKKQPAPALEFRIQQRGAINPDR